MIQLLIATNNKNKIREIRQVIESEFSDQVQLIYPELLGLETEVDETEDTLEGNSELKAKAYFELSGIPAIADDTGLEINALDGLPGVRSARFAGEPADDANNRKKVLEMMENIPLQNRQARFRTVICYYDHDGPNFIEGICEGIMAESESGTNGFGFDPIFIPSGYDITFAEMSAFEKNKISHRGKAIRNFVRWLRLKII